ncbi:MAG: hypothetical protein R3C32_02715 [Chloroflexota bacterium]
MVTPPVAAYSHSSGDGSTIIGGYVYRGATYPALAGAYLFGDYWQRRHLGAPRSGCRRTGTAVAEVVGQMDGTLSSFGQDEAGELYAVDLGGRMLRVTAAPR